ncbi:MAG: cupredoxin domain-containing protein [Acidimicrobiales bacterium]
MSVRSTADACEVSATEAPSGNVVFEVENGGSDVTEFYLLADDGLRIIGEVENIGPGITRNLVVRVAPGSYVTACKPNMTGDGIRGGFTVTDSGADGVAGAGETEELIATATEQYRLYVRDQVSQLVDKTEQFADLYAAGADDEGSCSVCRRERTGSGSNRWPNRSGISTRSSTCARPTSSPGRSGPAGTRSRRTCGRPMPATRH